MVHLVFCSYHFGRRIISGRFGKFGKGKKEKSRNPQDEGQNVVVEHREGNTYYRIENLNIYLSADVIHQLNLNTEKVINAIKDELKAEIDKIGKEQEMSSTDK